MPRWQRELPSSRAARPSRTSWCVARRLFATALETPGGLKIQTIHAFCEAVLHRFPLEANIPGHFSVLDDQKAAELLAEARRQLMSAQSFENDPDLADAVTRARYRRRERLRQAARRALCPPPRLSRL
jgi:ATP-dependent helicase/nuclease subunit A